MCILEDGATETEIMRQTETEMVRDIYRQRHTKIGDAPDIGGVYKWGQPNIGEDRVNRADRDTQRVPEMKSGVDSDRDSRMDRHRETEKDKGRE